MVSPAANWQAVASCAGSRGEQTAACRVIGCCTMTMRYEVVRQDDPVFRDRMKELAQARSSIEVPLVRSQGTTGRLSTAACILAAQVPEGKPQTPVPHLPE